MAREERSPAGGPTTRRLVAILHLDVVGFARMMGTDEAGTHARLKSRFGIAVQQIEEHRGRIVGSAGDSLLVEFQSVVDALAAAVAVQSAAAAANEALPEPERLRYRIGINLGDVIVDGDDVYGDGVNVAVRIEGLADPGGIVLSGTAYDQIGTHRGVVFRNCGTHRVKNIARPVRVYAVEAAADGIPGRLGGSRTRRRRLVAAALLASVVLAVVAGVAIERDRLQHWWNAGDGATEIAFGKPTLAVMPFRLRGTGVEPYFSDGVTEGVIADLGRFSGLFVLSWSAVAPYRDRPVGPDVLRRELGARYIVNGTVQRTGERLRVSVELTDADRGVLVWSERYDEAMAEVFAVQDKIARAVAASLAVSVTKAEERRALDIPTEDMGAYDLVLRGRSLIRELSRDANFDARALFERAARLDPQYADALVGVAITHVNDILYGWSEWPDRSFEQAEQALEKAIALDDGNASAHATLGYLLTYRREFDRADRETERAIELNPNSAYAHIVRGGFKNWSGRPEEAVAPLEFALRIDPHPPNWWVNELAAAYFMVGRYQDAVDLVRRFDSFDEDPTSYAIVTASLGQLGHLEEAREAAAELKKISPFFNPKTWADWFVGDEHRARILEGLRAAGVE